MSQWQFVNVPDPDEEVVRALAPRVLFRAMQDLQSGVPESTVCERLGVTIDVLKLWQQRYAGKSYRELLEYVGFQSFKEQIAIVDSNDKRTLRPDCIYARGKGSGPIRAQQRAALTQLARTRLYRVWKAQYIAELLGWYELTTELPLDPSAADDEAELQQEVLAVLAIEPPTTHLHECDHCAAPAHCNGLDCHPVICFRCSTRGPKAVRDLP